MLVNVPRCVIVRYRQTRRINLSGPFTGSATSEPGLGSAPPCNCLPASWWAVFDDFNLSSIFSRR